MTIFIFIFYFFNTENMVSSARPVSVSLEAAFKKKDARGQYQSSDSDVTRSLQRCQGDDRCGRSVSMATRFRRKNPLGSEVRQYARVLQPQQPGNDEILLKR